MELSAQGWVWGAGKGHACVCVSDIGTTQAQPSSPGVLREVGHPGENAGFRTKLKMVEISAGTDSEHSAGSTLLSPLRAACLRQFEGLSGQRGRSGPGTPPRPAGVQGPPVEPLGHSAESGDP